MPELSTFRLYLLRATYLLIAVGLGVTIWPGILHHSNDLALPRGVVRSLLGALAVVALLGVRYPVRMLPLLVFEFAWKTIWVLAFGVPLWLAGQLDADAQETMKACLMGVILVPLVLPWRHVFLQFAKLPGDRWGRQPAREDRR